MNLARAWEHTLTRRGGSERQHQVALFSWAARLEGHYPELALLYAIPNQAARRGPGARRLREEGLRTGMPDVCLPVPRAGRAALYVELKKPGARKPRETQELRMAMLARAGNLAVVCYGWDKAAEVIENYLAGRLWRIPHCDKPAC